MSCFFFQSLSTPQSLSSRIPSASTVANGAYQRGLRLDSAAIASASSDGSRSQHYDETLYFAAADASVTQHNAICVRGRHQRYGTTIYFTSADVSVTTNRYI